MKTVTRVKQLFDQELAAENKRRTYRTEYVVTATGIVPVYREKIIANSDQDWNRIPWWKRTAARNRRTTRKKS